MFRGNNIAGFASTVADVFLDSISYETVLVGRSGTVVDLGTDNRITGFGLTGLSIGPELQAAQARKRALLQTIR